MGGGKASVGFNKAGTINLNEKACERLELKTGDKIAIAQDEESPENWYIFKHEEGFDVRATSDKKGFVFNHSSLCKEIFKFFELSTDKSHRFLLAEEETKNEDDTTIYWGLLPPADKAEDD